MLDNLMILGIVGFATLSVAWFLGNVTITRPIKKLVVAVQRIGSGEMGARTGLPHTPDELGELAKSFDGMAALLEERIIEREIAEEALSEAYTGLEKKVQERTADLTHSNALLRQEIEERRRLEEVLTESERKFKALFQLSPEAIVLASFEEWRAYEVNEAYCRFFGYSREEIIGKTSVEQNIWVDQEDRRTLRAILISEGGVNDFECHLRTKSGEIKTALVSIETLELDGLPNQCKLSQSLKNREKTVIRDPAADIRSFAFTGQKPTERR